MSVEAYPWLNFQKWISSRLPRQSENVRKLSATKCPIADIFSQDFGETLSSYEFSFSTTKKLVVDTWCQGAPKFLSEIWFPRLILCEINHGYLTTYKIPKYFSATEIYLNQSWITTNPQIKYLGLNSSSRVVNFHLDAGLYVILIALRLGHRVLAILAKAYLELLKVS